MKIFFSKAAIAFSEWFSKSRFKDQSYLCCAIILLILGIILSGLFLSKIYEVPVYYTEYQVLHEGHMEDGELHFYLIRDYDRQKEADDNILTPLNEERGKRGGLIVEGFFQDKDKELTTHSTWFNESSELQNKIAAILDTARYDYNDGERVYVMVTGTDRQAVYIGKHDTEKSKEVQNIKDKWLSPYYHNGIYATHNIHNQYLHKNVWSIPVDSMFRYDSYRQNHFSFCGETFLFASINDSVIPVHTVAMGNRYEKPNPLVDAEDVSKLVEIIRLPMATAQFVKSLTIDYRCPTEFGHLNPEPDEKTISSIRYYDQKKIGKIAWDGLKVHAKFPDMENIQEIRLFALTTILTLLITAFFTCIYKLFADNVFAFYKKHTKACWWLLIALVIVVLAYALSFDYYTNVDYKNINYETFSNGHEWER
ncbi:MAG: hypothetical protein IJV45_08200 [Prevotella sp.]|nr:hypothetical protein [Prevotella sp.]MBR1934139.1 hypothetical protein [Prevotella sp.]